MAFDIRPASRPAPLQRKEKPRVMVVDEELDRLDASVRELENRGYAVTAVPVICIGLRENFLHEGQPNSELIAARCHGDPAKDSFFGPFLQYCGNAVHYPDEMRAILQQHPVDYVLAPQELVGAGFEGGAAAIAKMARDIAPRTAVLPYGSGDHLAACIASAGAGASISSVL